VNERSRTTLVGEVASVRGNVVSIRLISRDHSAVLIEGESYRVGQVGAFVRIPIGYADLYAVCVQVSSTPTASAALDEESIELSQTAGVGLASITATLFGEAVGGTFERGVSRYPTVGDPVHVATRSDVTTIYGRALGRDRISIGRIASSQGLPADLQLSSLLTRHAAIVGSTGSGKSNLVAVMLEEFAADHFTSARVLVVDPHGEYAEVLGDASKVIRTRTDKSGDQLHVPYWALPLNELIALTMGELPPSVLEHVRDRVREMKIAGAERLSDPPPPSSITADSPVPFSIWSLWFELEEDERRTYAHSNQQDSTTLLAPEDAGDAYNLRPPKYPPATSTNTAPYPNRTKRNIGRQLGLLRSRLRDPQFQFLFRPDHPTAPDGSGKVDADLDTVLEEWIGSDKPVTILDVSGMPPEALSSVVGTMVRIIYDALFWASSLPVGGRSQPLLLVVDEAHLFLPAAANTSAHRAFWRIAKEGRKYGVGLIAVTQRPSDIDANVLSQCGTFLSLRLTNGADRAAIVGSVPDDLSGLTQMLPALRTGEALVLGDALQVPSRVRVRLARNKPIGDDPLLPDAWLSPRPDPAGYSSAVRNWRMQATLPEEEPEDEQEEEKEEA
jgi:hypothetical protein